MNPQVQLQLIMLGVWAFIIGLSVRKLPKAIASRRWPRVSGQVISSHIRSTSVGNGARLHAPVVLYSYSVGGITYKSETFTYLGTAGAAFEWQVKKQLRLFKNGTTVQVYYNAIKPEEAVLVPGVHWVQYFSLLLISLFCLGGAFIVQILNFIWPGCQPHCT